MVFVYTSPMSVVEIQRAIKGLNSEEFDQLASWIEEERAREWDDQIARDAAAGRFDSLIESACQQYRAGLYREVDETGLH
jgi:hypothetical protein